MLMLSFALTAAAVLVSVLVAIFFCEVALAVASQPRKIGSLAGAERPKIAVVVPAHNEGRSLIPTLLDIKKQLKPRDRLIVVADNCSDDTAVLAAEVGAEVLKRDDPTRVGKGYALDWAIRALESSPPEAVLFVDADCRVAEGSIDQLVAACQGSSRPAQALNLVKAPENSGVNYQVAEFAWIVKNFARPQGLAVVGLPCQLMGTGMAFPWRIIRSANLASSEIVEDLKLGLDLAAAKHAAVFCPTACVTSAFPVSSDSAKVQRERWETGHVGIAVSTAPRLLFLAIMQRNLDLLVLTLDLMVPPLSLLGVLLIVFIFFAGAVALGGGSAVAISISAANAMVFVFAVFLAWLKFGRSVLPMRALPHVAIFVLGKLPLYRRILTRRRGAQWIRTDRDQGAPSPRRNSIHD